MTTPPAQQRLHFIIYTPFGSGTLLARPGALQHNCFVAAQRFLPLLQRIAEACDVADATTDIAAIAQAARQQGRQPLLLCFAPPQLLPIHPPCPLLAFFAWAYDTIPTDAWCGNPRNDWRVPLQACAGVVTHSQHALRAIETGTDGATTAAVIAAVIAVPVPESFFDLFDAARTPATAPEWALQFDGVVMDSYSLGLDRDIDGADIVYESTSNRCVFSGVVYCLVVDPIDKSKNWLDSMWAFAYAFRDNPQVTLVIKLCHHDIVRVCSVVHYEMRKLAPFRCRIVAIAAWLDDAAFTQLIKGSTYVVNSAHAEAQGLTLLEFMAAGKPAVTPAHTALADYIDEDSAFIVDSCLEWTHWPHDPRMMLRTHRHRIDWSSLHDALLQSHAVATQQIARYQAMSRHAHEVARRHCATAPTTQRLQQYISAVQQQLPAPAAPAPQAGFLKRSLQRLLARLRSRHPT